MALAEMNEKGDKARIQDLLELMWDNQLKDGLFLYSIDGYNSQHQRGDLSNALFAGLAMRAASQVGVTIKPTRWAELAKGALACWGVSDGLPQTGGRAEPRGFSYVPGGGQTSSMTVAGVSLLAIVTVLRRFCTHAVCGTPFGVTYIRNDIQGMSVGVLKPRSTPVDEPERHRAAK